MLPAILEGLNIFRTIADKWIPDAKDRLAAENMYLVQSFELSKGQLEVNKEEAKSSSVFVAGWRPFIGWVCGGNLAYAVIGHSLLSWLVDVVSILTDQALPPLPKPDLTLTAEALIGLLGLGTLRTYEKTKGVAS